MAINIGYLTQWFQPEPNPRGLSLIKGLREKGYEIKVLTAFPNYPHGKIYAGYKLSFFKKQKLDGVPIYRLIIFPYKGNSIIKKDLNFLSFAFSSALFCPFIFWNCNIILMYDLPPSYLLCVFLLKKLLKKKLIIDIQDLWPENVKATDIIRSEYAYNLLERIYNNFYKLADKLIVISPGYKTRLVERGFEEHKIEVVYNWSDSEETYLFEGNIKENGTNSSIEYLKKTEDEFTFVYAGNMGRAQKLIYLIKAFSKLDKKKKLYLIGDGVERRALIDYVKNNSIKNVFFLERLPSSLLCAYLRMADVLIVHLNSDPFLRMTIPSKTQSYMAAGKPILMIHDGDAAKLIEAARCGYTCEPGNIDKLIAIIIKFCELPENERKEYGANGKKYYIDEMSMRIGISKIDKILKNG